MKAPKEKTVKDSLVAILKSPADFAILKEQGWYRIAGAYAAFADEEGFARAADLETIAAQDYSLSIPLYVRRTSNGDGAAENHSLRRLWNEWEQQGRLFWEGMDTLVEMLDHLAEENPD